MRGIVLVELIGIGVDETIRYFPSAGYDTFSFSADALPTDGINSLSFDFSTGPNSPTNFAGETSSVDANGPVPSVSAWGLVALTLMVLAAGSVVLARGRSSSGTHPA